MEVVVTTGAIRRAKLQWNHHHRQTNTHLFSRPGALPVAQPTASDTICGKIRRLHPAIFPRFCRDIPGLEILGSEFREFPACVRSLYSHQIWCTHLEAPWYDLGRKVKMSTAGKCVGHGMCFVCGVYSACYFSQTVQCAFFVIFMAFVGCDTRQKCFSTFSSRTDG